MNKLSHEYRMMVWIANLGLLLTGMCVISGIAALIILMIV